MITERIFDERFGGQRSYWWPDYDNDPHRTFKYIQARYTDVDITAGLCARKRTVIQAGGHAGLFPIRLASMFKHVLTFEPDPACYAALERNTSRYPNIQTRTEALGDRPGKASLAIKKRPGGASMVDADEALNTVAVEVITIDSLALKNVDAMVIDVEHSECEVLRGATDTIARCSPVLHVEELARRREELRALIASLGYTLRRQVHGDAIYTRT